MDTPSITIVTRFTYRGLPEEVSNTYHFKGTQPATPAAWKTLGEAIFAAMAPCQVPDVKLVKLYGYNAGNETSVFQKNYVTDGDTLQTGSMTIGPGFSKFAGDQAGWIRAQTKISSKGKKVYIRKYIHGGFVNPTDPDTVAPAWKALVTTFMGKLLDGSLPGGFVWSGPQGETATAPLVGNFVTTRTLKRRGKRPRPAS